MERRENLGNIFTFYTYGQDKFGQALQIILSEQTFIGQPPLFIDLDKKKTPEKFQIIYFPKSEFARYLEALAELKALQILTVSDIGGFSKHGGMIEFVQMSNKIKLLINNDNALAVRLLIKANLMDIATLVKNEEHHPEM